MKASSNVTTLMADIKDSRPFESTKGYLAAHIVTAHAWRA